MYSFIYLSIALMFFLILYVFIGFELMVATLLFLIFLSLLTIIGLLNENKWIKIEFIKEKSGELPILLFDDIFDKLDAFRVEKIITMVNDDVFGQIFISDTHEERTETIIKTTEQSYRIYNL